jgi:hypothetical protein
MQEQRTDERKQQCGIYSIRTREKEEKKTKNKPRKLRIELHSSYSHLFNHILVINGSPNQNRSIMRAHKRYTVHKFTMLFFKGPFMRAQE